MVERDNLCMNILRCKYKIEMIDFERIQKKKKKSLMQKAIEDAKTLVTKDAYYVLEDDYSFNVQVHPWIPWLPKFKPKQKT